MFHCNKSVLAKLVQYRMRILADCGWGSLERNNNHNVNISTGKLPASAMPIGPEFDSVVNPSVNDSPSSVQQKHKQLKLKHRCNATNSNTIRGSSHMHSRSCDKSCVTGSGIGLVTIARSQRINLSYAWMGNRNHVHQMSTVGLGSSGIKAPRECWNCGKLLIEQICNKNTDNWSHPADAFYCSHEHCGVLQPPYAENYFEPFDLPIDYDIDTSRLSKIYRKIQQKLHPDKSANLSQKEKEFADAQSTLVNKAYDTLLKPIPRALYLLELNGLSLEEKDVDVDPNILMDVMDINEEIADTSDNSRLREIFDDNRQKMDSLVKEISRAFKDQDYSKAKLLIAEIKYFVNIEDKIKEKTYFH